MKKHLILVLTVFLIGALVAGCSTGMDAETELAACRAALEEIRNREDYHIWILGENEGENILNGTNDREYWKHGSDWLRVIRIPESGILDDSVVRESISAAMCYDGSYFENKTDRLGNILWNPVDEAEEVTPWLFSFDWDAQEVRYINTEENGLGRSVQLQVLSPYELPEGTAQSYTVEFFFKTDGDFYKAVLRASCEEMGIADSMYLVSTNAERIAEDIEEQYQRAVG